MLGLSANRIGDEGLQYIANALASNAVRRFFPENFLFNFAIRYRHWRCWILIQTKYVTKEQYIWVIYYTLRWFEYSIHILPLINTDTHHIEYQKQQILPWKYPTFHRHVSEAWKNSLFLRTRWKHALIVVYWFSVFVATLLVFYYV
jgi:hypothetical protein